MSITYDRKVYEYLWWMNTSLQEKEKVSLATNQTDTHKIQRTKRVGSKISRRINFEHKTTT